MIQSTQVKDNQLSQISNLSRLPWIGEDFLQSNRRLLIVGESHYAQGATVAEYQEDRSRQNDPNFTRKLIEETQIQNLDRYLLLDNFWKAFFGRSSVNPKVWNHVSYYNFVQRSMDYSTFDGEKKEQPNTADFKLGWQVFAEVIKIIQPTDCIFLGLKASEGFGNLKTDHEITDFQYKYAPKIGNMTPLKGLVKIKGQPIDVSFIQHCSSYFSPSSWHSFLEENHQSTIDFLESKA